MHLLQVVFRITLTQIHVEHFQCRPDKRGVFPVRNLFFFFLKNKRIWLVVKNGREGTRKKETYECNTPDDDPIRFSGHVQERF